MKLIKDVLDCLPQRAADCLESLSDEAIGKITELKLRAERPLAVTFVGGIGYLEMGAISVLPSCRNIIISKDELEDSFVKLCENSVYSHENELMHGYISLKSGNRAGVCGTTVIRTDGSCWIRDISSINIRVANEVIGCATKLVSQKLSGGVLICGAPHTGKTTLLRDYIRKISTLGETVALIDCRGEIAASNSGIPTLDVGINTDVTTGGTKRQGIENALRGLSPDVIAFDEIGGRDELNSIADCLSAGVRIITTLHAGGIGELLKRNKTLKILETGAFDNIVMLNKRYEPQIFKVGDLIDKTSGGRCDNSFVLGFGDDLILKTQQEGKTTCSAEKVCGRSKGEHTV